MGLGSLRCRDDSSSGTRMMARFSSSETVPEFTVLRASISQLMTRKKRKPTRAPPLTVQRSSFFTTFFPNRAASSKNASKNRTASILKALMVPRPTLLNTKDVLRAIITDAISTSAFLSDIWIPPGSFLAFSTDIISSGDEFVKDKDYFWRIGAFSALKAGDFCAIL